MLNEKIKAIPMPDKFKKLPVDERGFPVPRFVPWLPDDQGVLRPEFRGFNPEHMKLCVTHKRCWLCGEPLGVHMTFVIGPMCAVNRISSEPPSHHGCAEYSAKACPFLSMPRAKRNEKDMPLEAKDPAGIMLKRNPGVTLLWTTPMYSVIRANQGVLFKVGPPEKLEFFAEGRKATREEIMESINTGLPHLVEMAKKDGPEAELQLLHMTTAAMQLVEQFA